MHFQLKLFDAAVTLKYNQGHRKWYEWGNLGEYCHYAKLDIIISIAFGKIATLKFLPHVDTPPITIYSYF